MATYIVPRNYTTLYLAVVKKLLEFFIVKFIYCILFLDAPIYPPLNLSLL
jgi:hypothetical protein